MPFSVGVAFGAGGLVPVLPNALVGSSGASPPPPRDLPISLPPNIVYAPSQSENAGEPLIYSPPDPQSREQRPAGEEAEDEEGAVAEGEEDDAETAASPQDEPLAETPAEEEPVALAKAAGAPLAQRTIDEAQFHVGVNGPIHLRPQIAEAAQMLQAVQASRAALSAPADQPVLPLATEMRHPSRIVAQAAYALIGDAQAQDRAALALVRRA